MSLRLRTNTWDHFVYGAAVGALVGAIAGGLDAGGLVLWGKNIPWELPGLLIVSYVVSGSLGGGLLAIMLPIIAGRRCASEDTGSLHAAIRRVVLVACGVVMVVVFVERVQAESFGQVGQGFGFASMMVALAGLIVGIFLSSRPTFRWFFSGGLVWPVVWMILFCILWEPFNRFYKAPALSLTGLRGNLGYLGLAAVAWLVVRWIACRLPILFPVATMRQCARSTALFGVIGLLFSWAVLWCTQDKPIDLSYRELAEIGDVAEADSSHVILVVMDTVRADHLSVHGYHRNTTPNLNAFAREAVLYKRAVATSSWTVPTHGSLFTGLMPSEHGAYRRTETKTEADGLYQPLADHHVTLAEILSVHGYYTGGIVGNSGFLKRELGFAQGFFYYDDRDRCVISTAAPKVLSPALWWCQLYKRIIRGDWNWRRPADEVNASSLAWIDRKVDRPLFLFINYMDPHTPYRAHSEFDEQLGLATSSAHNKPLKPSDKKSWGHHDPAMQDDVDRYDSEIAYVDAHLGELFAHLKAKDLYDNSLIIVTSDHGEAFGEHGMTDHGNSPYEEEVHVPLLIRYPGSAIRGTEEAVTSLVSVMPTILEYLGIEHPDPSWLADRRKQTTVMAEVRPFKDRRGRSKGQWVSRALYQGSGMKVITEPVVDGQAELYDLTGDPHERRNMAGQQQAVVDGAHDWLDAWCAEALRRQVQGGDVRSTRLSEDLVAKLRSIGYVK